MYTTSIQNSSGNFVIGSENSENIWSAAARRPKKILETLQKPSDRAFLRLRTLKLPRTLKSQSRFLEFRFPVSQMFPDAFSPSYDPNALIPRDPQCVDSKDRFVSQDS